MSWTTVIWSAVAGICLTLAGVHLLVWVKSRAAWANLFFSFASVSAAAAVMCELRLMHAPTPQVYDQLLRLSYVPIALLAVSLGWFAHFYLKGGRAWLVWLLCACRALILALGIPMESSMHFRAITGLHEIQFLGETVVTPVGVPNPWVIAGNVPTLLLIVIAINGGLAAWRRGGRRQAAIISGAIAGTSVLGITMSMMLAAGMLRMPYTLSMVFLITVLGMAYELSMDLLNANRLAGELGENQERMNLAISAADLNLWEYDLARDVVWTTEKGLERAGVASAKQINADVFFQSVHPEDREAARNAGLRAIEGGGEFQVEYRTNDPAGATRWIRASGQVERDAHGKPLRIRGVSVDITKRKLAEEALQRSEHLARILLNTHNAVAHLLDVDGTIIDLNEYLAKALGRTREELIGTNVFDGVPQELVVRRKEMLRRAASEQKQIRFEDSHSDGSIIFDTFIYPAETPPGEKQRLVVVAHNITDHKRIENTLRESELMLKEAQKLARVGGWSWTVGADKVAWSETLYEIVGLDPKGPPPKYSEHASLYTVASWEKLSQALARAVKEGQPYDLELEMIRPDGRICYTHTRGEVVKSSGRVVRLFGTVQDVTERKQAETKAQQLQVYRDMGQEVLLILSGLGSVRDLMQRVVAIVKASTGVDAVGIRLQDRDDYPYFYQEGFSKAFLHKENSLLRRERDGDICRDSNGKVSLECTCGLVISGNTDPSNPLFTRGGSAWTNDSFQLLDLPAHQDPRTNPRNECIHQGYASVALIPIRAKGQIVGLLQLNDHKKGRFTLETVELLEGIAENIGEAMLRKQAEEALKESEERLKEAQRTARIGSWELDLLTDKLIWSDEIFRIFGIDKKDFGASYEYFLSVVHPDDREAVSAAYAQSLKTQKPYAITHRLLMPDGHIKHVHEQCETFYSTDGKPLRSVGTVQDITERVEGERDRTELRLELAHFGRTTTLNELASSLAHEINQPLGAILRNAEAAELLLQQNPPDLEEVAAILGDIRKDDHRAGAVIDRMRGMVKHRDMSFESLSLEEMVDNVTGLVKTEAQGRGVRLQVRLPASLPPVRGDPVHLQQVLLNLILNGLDAMDGRPGEGRLEVLVRLADAETVEVAVSDRGPGIPSEAMPRLFDPFFTTKPHGLGMGLPIARTCVESHGGRIWAENNPEGGATVRFTLKVAGGAGGVSSEQ